MPSSRTSRIAALALLAVLGLSGCDQGNRIGEADSTATTLVVSATYVHDAADGEATARLAVLKRSIDDLRATTGSGWVGRQDDLTGYLGELTGGRYFAGQGASAGDVIVGFLDQYGSGLFGIGSGDLVLSPVSTPSVTGSATVRGLQQVSGVPVLDGTLVFTIGDAAGEPRINAVRGRSFSDLEVATTPRLSAGRAARIAERTSGGLRQGDPQLVVVPIGSGILAWQVSVGTGGGTTEALAPDDGLYFVDATTGDLLSVRAASAESHPAVLSGLRPRTVSTVSRVGGAAAKLPLQDYPGSVQVTGTGPGGQALTAYGVRTDRGVTLVDTTVPTFDPDSGKGGIETYDAQGTQDTAGLPGRRYTERAQNGTTVTDPDALAAQAFSRAVYDYYASLGRASWDGRGSTLVSSVHYGDNTFCNSFFSGSLDPPQMVYGNPCAPGGTPAELTELDIDTAGHEITHGVTDSSAGLVYSGQSGALNESFSDYFGNVIGNAFKSIDTAAVMESSCQGIASPTIMCRPNDEGTLSTRYMLNGNTFDDYLFALNIPLRLSELGLSDQDHGGVHLNSSIWNNALWSIRARLAQIDGTDANSSKLAGDFDKIVYAALTTQLGPTSGFVDARRAVEQTIVDAQADPVILRVAKEVFDTNKICAGCSSTGTVPGVVVSASAQTEIVPVVHGDSFAWLDQGDGVMASATSATIGGEPTAASDAPDTAQVVFGGDALVLLKYPNGQLPGQVVRDDAGTRTVLGVAGRSTLTSGIAGSDDGAAWISEEDGSLSYVDAGGKVTSAALPDLGGDSITAVATGGGEVALGTGSGRVLFWTPGGSFTRAGRVPGAVVSLASYGDLALAVDDGGNALLVDPTGSSTSLSTSAMPFGAALGPDYAVWVEGLGDLGGGVATTEGYALPDSDLYLYSMDSGNVYDLLPERGQQGFPSLSGDRLVWQDSVYGGDDVLTATIPSGL